MSAHLAMRSGNPALGADTPRVMTDEALTVTGAVNTTALALAAAYTTPAYPALSLVLDFDFIEQGAECGVPKCMEWYAAFGLLVTLVWLCLELLRLLAKL